MIALYWLWRLGSFCAGHLPVGLCHGIADLAGTLAYWVLPRQQRHARHNFAQVMGKSADDAAVKRVTRQSFRNFTRYLFEVMRFPYVTPAELDQRVVLHQPEQFEQAVNQNKGVIFVSAHFGNMDLAGVQIARTIRRVTLAAEALKPQQIYDWLVANRARYNVRLIPYRQAAKGLMAALRANEFVGMFLDLGIRYDHRGVPVQFFGETAYFPAAAALLAHHTGAPIIQGYAVVGDDGRIHGHTFPTIYTDPAQDKDVCVQHITQQMASNMEQFIRQYPEQWYIFRRIWPDRAQAEPRKTRRLGHQVG